MLLLKIFLESFRFAIQALIGNRLRTFLSLLGVTIGIFAIVSVFAVVDSLERNIRDSVESLGDNVIFVNKWPWAMSGEYPWWKYYQRPVPSLQELSTLEQRLELAQAVAFVAGAKSKTVKYESNDVEGVEVGAVSHGYQDVYGFELSSGRYFSLLESNSGKPVAIIGSNISEELFQGVNPLGKVINFMGKRAKVIGVFEKVGESIIGDSDDDKIIVPVKFAGNFMRLNRESTSPMFLVRAKLGVSNAQLKGDLTRVMRSVRKLSPKVEDNFALNEVSILSKGIDSLFSVIDLAGIIIGGFSLLVGGFGIANIMFVSVKERTNIIGIQKAIGSKNYFILLQFLFEAILLCLTGGFLGLLLVYFGTIWVTNFIDFNVTLSIHNILTGLFASLVIGVVSGMLPALSASRLDPVEAIRSGQ